MEKLPPEKSGNAEEIETPKTETNQNSIGPFRSLAKRLLGVSPAEIREKEQEWRKGREAEH